MNIENEKVKIGEDFISIEFKAINDGLGFHQQHSEPPKQVKKVVSTSLKKDVHLATTSTKLPNMGELAPFYNSFKIDNNHDLHSPNNLEVKIPTAPLKTEQQFEDASITKQFAAGLIDLGFILSIAAGTIYFVLMFLKLQFPFQDINFFEHDILIYSSTLVVIYYLAYFVFFEFFTGKTLGKEFFSLKTISIVNSNNLSFSQAIGRALVGVLSMALLGLPLLLNFQGRLTDTITKKMK